MGRVYNFAAGPAAMPLGALEAAAAELTDFRGAGVSVMEMTHRSGAYRAIFDETIGLIRELMGVPDHYRVLLAQGGATLQFAAVPLNLLGRGADYVDSGYFAHSALSEAMKYGAARSAASTRDQGYRRAPEGSEADVDPNADYVHVTTNNTIYGTRIPSLPPGRGVPIVADMSSNILSEAYDVRDFGVIYAGAQKNIGPAGLTVIIVREDLLGRARRETPKAMDWKAMDEAGSMLNTPPTFAVYMAGLCLKWLKARGGVEAIQRENLEKSRLLYDCLDRSERFVPYADAGSRSRMNVTFRTESDAGDERFAAEAERAGLVNLRGHRLTGGIRASLYNAMPLEGVRALVEFMEEYERRG